MYKDGDIAVGEMSSSISDGAYHHVKIEKEANAVKVYVDDKECLNYTFDANKESDKDFFDIKTGYMGLGLWDGAVSFKNLYVDKKEETKAAEEEKAEEKASEGSQNEEPEKTVIYYVTDEVQQSQYINMFREAGKDAVLLKHVIDSQFISHLEQQDQTIQFKRIDADLTEELREDGEADETTVKTLTEVFRKNLGKDKLEVKVEKLKNEGTAAMITLPEESRRMQDMMKMYNMYGMDPNMFGGQEVLVLNANHPLVRFIAENQGSEYVPVICEQLYDLAMMSHKQLSPEEMTKFVKRSNDILMVLTK